MEWYCQHLTEVHFALFRQTFKHDIICAAYDHLNHIIETKGIKAAGSITDDAMVVETFTNQKVYLSEGSYENIKLTTPEDMTAAHGILSARTHEL